MQTRVYCRNVVHMHISSCRPLSTSQLKKYFDILKVDKSSTPKDIKESFLRLSKIYHPDNKVTGSHSRFVELKEAYDAIKDGTASTTASNTPNYRYYDDDISHKDHVNFRERYRDYQTIYERGRSHSFGGPYARSSTPWEDLKSDREFRKQRAYNGSFGNRAGRPLINITIFLSAIAWVIIYSSAILMWDYNNQVKKARYEAENYYKKRV